MNQVLKAVATVIVCGLLATTTGCSSIPGQPLTQDQQNNVSSPFNPGAGNWGWNDSNQNG
jgi:hypothetical protein